ncbi:MAG TPA: ABC transporter permease, partial [Gemmataceae bacterium]|nr:ABC transporter permease [Gemmataceae bacterium]
MVPLRYNFRNLVVRWKTTLLTALGFMLVVALLEVMLAFVQGLVALSKKTGPEGNVIVLRFGTNDELMSELDIDVVKSAMDSQWRQQDAVLRDGEVLRVSPEVYSLATQELPKSSPEARSEYRFLQIRGVDDPEIAGRVHGLGLLAGGRWFDRRAGDEMVVGEGLARTIGLKVGDTLEPKPGIVWKVVGVLDTRGSPFDSEIWAKREEVGREFGKDNEQKKFYTSVVVSTPNLRTAEKVAEVMRADTSVSVNALTERKYYEELSKGNAAFMFAALFIAAVMGVGGMFGLMNTMFAAVSQRLNDIGVLRVMGYTRGQILLSFLLESLLLALVGGGLGLLLGYLVNGVEQTGMISSGAGGGKFVVFKMTVDAWVLKLCVGFTLAMGLLGGLLPALSAMR